MESCSNSDGSSSRASRSEPAMKPAFMCARIRCWTHQDCVIQGPTRRQKREEGSTLQEAQARVGLGLKVSVSS